MKDIQDKLTPGDADGSGDIGIGSGVSRSMLFGVGLSLVLGIKLLLVATGIFMGYYSFVVIGLAVLAGALIWNFVVRAS